MNIKREFASNLELAIEEKWPNPNFVAATWTTEELVRQVNSEADRRKWGQIELINKHHIDPHLTY